ncbi:MAG: MoxR family ATPase [Pseudomonadota bacterium]
MIDLTSARQNNATSPDRLTSSEFEHIEYGDDYISTGDDLPVRDKIKAVMNEIRTVLYGKDLQICYALCCIIGRGHLLMDDVPGVGKTTLATLMAKVLGLGSQRIQFTSDLLPSDITGVSVYDEENKRFKFIAGPVFTQVLIADEINRTTAKTQSALLEAMAEFRVTTEGMSRDLPVPFFVVATQNPDNQIGTFPLPESQMDRFLMRISMGYPDASSEIKLLRGEMNFKARLAGAAEILSTPEVLELQRMADDVSIADSIVEYIHRLLTYTRESSHIFSYGISPRGGLALIQAVKAWAILEGRDYVEPDDVQALIYPVWSHRFVSVDGSMTQTELISHLLESVPVVV